MSCPLQFFYFDLGNVLLRFDHEQAARQMAEVAGVTPELVKKVVFGSDLEWRYEAGDISTDEFYDIFCRETDSTPQREPLYRAAADIFELNVPVVPIVAGLRSVGARLGILSNTNEVHWKFVAGGRYRILNGHFEKIALSYEIQSMKPDAAIYRAAVELTGVAPNEVFFVDDRAENVAGAREFGIDAVQFTTAHQLVRDLRERGVELNI